MSRVVDSNAFNGDLVSAVNHLLNIPQTLEKFMSPSGAHETKSVSSIPVDILDTTKEYVFFMDIPGLSKSDIQVRCCSLPYASDLLTCWLSLL